MKNLNKKIKKWDIWDIVLIKLSVVSFIIIILKLSSFVSGWIEKINIWWFVLILIFFMIRPCKRFGGF